MWHGTGTKAYNSESKDHKFEAIAEDLTEWPARFQKNPQAPKSVNSAKYLDTRAHTKKGTPKATITLLCCWLVGIEIIACLPLEVLQVRCAQTKPDLMQI